MLILAMIFTNVNLWCPIWGRAKRTGQRKIYLVARGKKKTIYKSNYRVFINLLKNNTWGKDRQFLKKTVHDDEKVQTWVSVCQNIKDEITAFDFTESDEAAAVTEWVELLTNNLTLLPKNKHIE